MIRETDLHPSVEAEYEELSLGHERPWLPERDIRSSVARENMANRVQAIYVGSYERDIFNRAQRGRLKKMEFELSMSCTTRVSYLTERSEGG